MGSVQAFGIEGTGSYGAGLWRFLRERGHTVVEVNRPNRQSRYQQGKSDAVDAESAARAVLAGQAASQSKSGTGTVEMIRHLKIARDTAVKARTQAMQTIKAIIVCYPDALREQFDKINGKMTLLRRLATLRPGPLTSTLASAKASLRGAVVAVDNSTDCIAKIAQQMPAVRDLDRFRRALTDPVCTGTGTIARDHFNARMLAKPISKGLGLPIWKKINHLIVLKVDKDGSVAMAAPPSPIIHAKNLRRWCRSY
jgi:hypothetical protein